VPHERGSQRVKRSTKRSMAIVSVVFLVGCSPSQSAFKHEAEKTINSDDGKKLPVDVTDATCEAPSSTEAETTFPCQAVDASGITYTFVARITSSNQFEIVPN
jgi:hypothetical protein